MHAIIDQSQQRDWMVKHQIEARGVKSRRVLEAMRTVPRELFLPAALHEFAYEDAPLPIAGNQTISQPYIVAMMIDALDLKGGETVLDIGTGSGYAAAVLSCIAARVYSVERIVQLAEDAKAVFQAHGFNNIHVLQGDGTRGWPEHAPYDAIIVAAGGPMVPESLKNQLKIGGRLIIPVGFDQLSQELIRVTRIGEHEFKTEDLADVRFVPLLGEEGWKQERFEATERRQPAPPPVAEIKLAALIADRCESFTDIEYVDLAPLMKRIGDARIVLLGESSHGTSEFYRLRARITRELIESKGFSFVAIEGDWPDAARIDHYVRHAEYPPSEWTAFARFPTWMWRNEEVRHFVDWLRAYNADRSSNERIAFHGLDLYSLYNSIRSILDYLQSVDPATAEVARQRYGCLTPWQSDPAAYGHAALTRQYQDCEQEVVTMLKELLTKRQAYAEHDGERFLDAVQNARLVTNAERYYRTMYYGSRSSWNLRDSHMFDTLVALLAHHGPESKAVIWAHNSHVGDSAATEMSQRGEFNIGHLCRRQFGENAYAIGLGTDTGTVAAAENWDSPMEIMTVRPALENSYEWLCHDSGIDRFLLPLRTARDPGLIQGLNQARLQRAIGVIYRPESERQSHYFTAKLPQQFDEFIWFDRTTAIKPLATEMLKSLPDTYPFGI
ncbi:protein-L-isoaspartate O-methyltransferase [Halothiobacillus diazotrophicus]|uniref:Protein-L-isoaspartate O-methyltransferase n=1 Tax=Halothiobacillus diazotrophicus TaxID=1860122 RepID=A0A191ZJW8_9GAMM|nr:protein-L-isoaspartate(D-aspartate) O-methyltransferase [Halothiobacillus diazotrophicus]ANJ68201.1 protein-L-isoaspartate O-methyltransferase [Halothiobacillus diazotrophicus]